MGLTGETQDKCLLLMKQAKYQWVEADEALKEELGCQGGGILSGNSS